MSINTLLENGVKRLFFLFKFLLSDKNSVTHLGIARPGFPREIAVILLFTGE